MNDKTLKWVEKMDRIHRIVARQAKPPREPYGVEDSHFLALALAGEAGELANFVKKEWRGDFRIDDPRYIKFVRKEIADCRIQIELLAYCFAIDLDEECDRKLDEFFRKWKRMRARRRRRKS